MLGGLHPALQTRYRNGQVGFTNGIFAQQIAVQPLTWLKQQTEDRGLPFVVHDWTKHLPLTDHLLLQRYAMIQMRRQP